MHVLETQANSELRRCLLCTGLPLSPVPRPGHVTLLPINLSNLEPLIRVKSADNQRLKATATFARLFIPSFLPGVTTSMYVDCDTIFQADVVAFLDTWRWQPNAVLAADVWHRNVSYMFPKARKLYTERHRSIMDESRPLFNSGVLLLHHPVWQHHNISTEVVWWMQQHKTAPNGLWFLGSQPPLQIAAYGLWQVLPPEWNVDHLAEVAQPLEEVAAGKLLHWSGFAHKPWSNDPLHFDAWVKHLLPAQGVRYCQCLLVGTGNLDQNSPYRKFLKTNGIDARSPRTDDGSSQPMR